MATHGHGVTDTKTGVRYQQSTVSTGGSKVQVLRPEHAHESVRRAAAPAQGPVTVEQRAPEVSRGGSTREAAGNGVTTGGAALRARLEASRRKR
jgi:hypothetical protein